MKGSCGEAFRSMRQRRAEAVERATVAVNVLAWLISKVYGMVDSRSGSGSGQQDPTATEGSRDLRMFEGFENVGF